MDVLRIANCSGFYGDRLSAAREVIEGGPIDVLTGDYLAELTMMILAKDRMKSPDTGFAKTFLRQMEDVLGLCCERGIKVVVNAGGLNPAGLAERLRELAGKAGVAAKIAHIEGDDLQPELARLQAAGHELRNLDTGKTLAEVSPNIVTANAYLGAWGIVTALERGADIVVCPRVTDAALVVGPAAWKFGWSREHWHELASAVVAGHIIECGTQCTGGNYSFFEEIPGLERPGFPIAEMRADGSFVITKHPGTGGRVSIGTITAQLLYEIQGIRYLNPDVTTRFDSIRVSDAGEDRVLVSGVRGEPPPATTKVCINFLGGFRNSMTFVVAGLDVEKKAALAEKTLWHLLGGRERFAAADVQLIRSDRPDPTVNDDAFAYLRVTVKDADQRKVGRAFSNCAVEMALASYPGFFLTSPPGEGSAFGVYWPTLVPSEEIDQRVVIDGTPIPVPPPPQAGREQEAAVAPVEIPDAPHGPTRRVPLGVLCGARSGDKGGNANVGFWVRTPEAYAWMEQTLTVAKLRELLPEAAGLEIERYPLPNLLSVNFIVKGLLGEGVASSTRSDPQAKSFGEFLRAKLVDVPEALL